MFEFVTVSHPAEAGEKVKQRRIRQHAIRTGLQSKRKETAKTNGNFVAVQIDPSSGKVKPRRRESALVKQLSAEKLDPFETLPGSGERLRLLMQHKNAKQAGEPVFCVEEAGKLFFEGMETVFKGALSDPTLFHAFSLALSLAANKNVPNFECLVHRGATLENLRVRMSNPVLVPSISTLTAMLMLIGYEYRVDGSGARSIAMHIRALRSILDLTDAANIAVAMALRRAVFWQDLYSCFFVDTPRMFSHECYSELNCTEKLSTSPRYHLPYGFQSVLLIVASDLPNPTLVLSPDLEERRTGVGLPSSSDYAEILRDLNALCQILDSRYTPGVLPINEIPVDDFQFNIESRLVDRLRELRNRGIHDPIYEACLFATFLCTYMLSTGIWEGCFIPDYCASQVLGLVSRAKNDLRWKQWKKLLLWLLFISGALTRNTATRIRAMVLVQDVFEEHVRGLHENWEFLKDLLKDFIWSSQAMERQCQQLWEHMQEQFRSGTHTQALEAFQEVEMHAP